MAQQSGTLVTAQVKKNDSLDPIATFDANEGQGGNYSVTTITDRDAIISAGRRWGMLANVYNDGGSTGTYQLTYAHADTDLMNNSNWVAFAGGGGGTPTFESVLAYSESINPTTYASQLIGDHFFERDLSNTPSAPTVVLAGAGIGNVDNGSHRYVVTYVTTNKGESLPSFHTDVTVTDKTTNGKVHITVPSPLSQREVAYIRIYRSAAGTTTPLFALPDVIPFFGDNAMGYVANLGISMTFTDNNADSTLSSFNPPSSNGAFNVTQSWEDYNKIGQGLEVPLNPQHLVTSFGNEQGSLTEPFWGSFSGRHQNVSPKGVAGYIFKSDYAEGWIGAVGSQSTYSSGDYAGRFLVGAGLGGNTTGLTLAGSDIQINAGAGQFSIDDHGAINIFGASTNGANNPWFLFQTPAMSHIPITSESISVYFDFFGTKQLNDSTVAVQRDFVIGAMDYTAYTSLVTITKAATFAIEGAPTSGSGKATIVNPMAFWIQSGATQFDGQIREHEGTAFTTTGTTVTLVEDGNFYRINVSGSFNVLRFITVGNLTSGTIITLKCNDPVNFVNASGGGAGGTAKLFLSGSTDFIAGINDALTLMYDGTDNVFREVSRYTS